VPFGVVPTPAHQVASVTIPSRGPKAGEVFKTCVSSMNFLSSTPVPPLFTASLLPTSNTTRNTAISTMSSNWTSQLQFVSRDDYHDSGLGCDVYDILTREHRFVVNRDGYGQIRFYYPSGSKFAEVNFPPGGPCVNEPGAEFDWYFKDWYDPIFTLSRLEYPYLTSDLCTAQGGLAFRYPSCMAAERPWYQ
jgi:hypothetical protein